MSHTLGIDLYQLTTLVAHAAEGRLPQDLLEMTCLFRRLPPQRNYVVFAGVHAAVAHLQAWQLKPDELACLQAHPLLQSVWHTPAGSQVWKALQQQRGFFGDIDALPEGTLAFAGPAYRLDGTPAVVQGERVHAYTPLVRIRTSLLAAKLLETPLMSRVNFFSQIASKAARMVWAAGADGRERPVLEFGQRRIHPEAAIDAAYAAYLGGCVGTSNVAATLRHGIPSFGTMDHFAVLAAEQPGLNPHATERAFFHTFGRLFPQATTLLIDTYDPWTGLQQALQTPGCTGIRLDSHVTPDVVRRIKQLLHEHNASHIALWLSGNLDEHAIHRLAAAGADGFGVGEQLVCTPDAPAGIGAVCKLSVNTYGTPVRKQTPGKATLPGSLAAYRFPGYDLLTLAEEPAPAGGLPLLKPVWRASSPVALPSLADSRQWVQQQIRALPSALQALESAPVAEQWRLVLSDALFATTVHRH